MAVKPGVVEALGTLLIHCPRGPKSPDHGRNDKDQAIV